MSMARATYSLTLSPLSIGQMLNSARSMEGAPFDWCWRSIIRAMRKWLLLAILCGASVASAAEPATKPVRAARPTMQGATEALGLLGPVRVANYTRTFAPPKVDPHQQYRDRYMYGLPAYSPYLYCGCGYPY